MAAPSDDTNGFLDSANSLLATFTAAGTQAANIYSTFLNAQANLKVAEAQKADAQKQSSTGPQARDLIDALSNSTNILIYGAIGLALLGTGWIVWKAVKK